MAPIMPPVVLSKTEQAILLLLAQSPSGIDDLRLINMLYMADVVARQYLGHPITEIEWYRGPEGAVSLLRSAVVPGMNPLASGDMSGDRTGKTAITTPETASIQGEQP